MPKQSQAFQRVTCRAHFDLALSGKENKDVLKAEVVRALAGLGLAIDEGDVKFHHFKLVHKKNKKPKFVVMGLDVGEGPSLNKMKSSSAFSTEGRGFFTVRWAEMAVGNDVGNDVKKDVGKDAERTGVGRLARRSIKQHGNQNESSNQQRVSTPPKKTQPSSKKAMLSHTDSASMLNDKDSGSMTGTLLAGVLCAVGLGGAMLMGYHHRGLVGMGVGWVGGLRGGR